MLPACGHHGLGTMVWSPLGGGVVTGKYSRGSAPAADTRYARLSVLTAQGISSRQFDIAEKVAEIADRLGTISTAVAVAWVLGRRHITSVIIGPRTFELSELTNSLSTAGSAELLGYPPSITSESRSVGAVTTQ